MRRRPLITAMLVSALMGALTSWWVTEDKPSWRQPSTVSPPSVHAKALSVQLQAIAESDMPPTAQTAPAAPQGSMPGVVADYRRSLGFRRYAKAMTNLGGRFVLWDSQQRKLVAALDLDAGTLRLLNKNQLRGLSPRARDLSAEAALTSYRQQQKNTSVLLLVPQAVDAIILKELQQATVQTLTTVHGVYSIERGDLLLTLTSGTNKAGKTIALHAVCNLSAAVRNQL